MRVTMTTTAKVLAAAAPLAVLTACGGGSADSADGPVIGLITKTDSNPFFVKMKEGAQQAADENGLTLQTFAGQQDGDNESQVAAIESLISAGAEGFLIVPNDSKAIVPALDKARAQGMAVIALDTQTDPADAVDATFATDNYRAGLLIGQWAAAKFEAEGTEARIALLDATPNQTTVEVQRDQGFLEGFGIDVGDPDRIGDETDPRIVGNEVTAGNEEGGRTAMENLLQRDPTINLVYTINEPAAAGAYAALQAAGREDDVTIVSVDGSCPGVEDVASGVIGATAMQFPLDMASLGVDALAEFVESGTTPAPPEGEDFVDTGVQLITDEAQPGVESEDTAWGRENCWG